MWELKYQPKVLKTLTKLDKQTSQKIIEYLEKISKDPESFGKPLRADLSGFWRYRIGKYRIICDLRKEELIVLIVKIDKRDEVYN